MARILHIATVADTRDRGGVSGGETLPHLYGPLSPAAVVAVRLLDDLVPTVDR